MNVILSGFVELHYAVTVFASINVALALHNIAGLPSRSSFLREQKGAKTGGGGNRTRVRWGACGVTTGLASSCSRRVVVTRQNRGTASLVLFKKF